ncbi:hypothetical protein [Kitasatospora sp. NPDC050463]|uniref:hypothetical protein n=1 Tax=Kitasatospora sp. NPDC050463 TaxID=3155786 RepID=UPI0033EF110F
MGEYVMVRLNGGTKETAESVIRALAGAFEQQSPGAPAPPADPGAPPEPSDVWTVSYRIDGPGRPIDAHAHQLVGAIDAELAGAPGAVAHVIDALQTFADVGEPGTVQQRQAAKTLLHLRPA